jgi:translation initiation factor 2 beta subunit (eIF-2beta)/eIF-5
MSMSLNINQNALDIFYRYKMDPIKITKTGRSGNIHTNLDNIDKIASKINTSTDILLQYIGNTIGCNINKDTKSGKNITYYLKGDYDATLIQEIIYKFINFASLCQECTIPELTPGIKKKKLYMSCSACGCSYELVGNNKYNDKLVENMIKYYTNNEFVSGKGNMVSKKPSDESNNNPPKVEKTKKTKKSNMNEPSDSDGSDSSNESESSTKNERRNNDPLKGYKLNNYVDINGRRMEPLVYTITNDD